MIQIFYLIVMTDYVSESVFISILTFDMYNLILNQSSHNDNLRMTLILLYFFQTYNMFNALTVAHVTLGNRKGAVFGRLKFFFLRKLPYNLPYPSVGLLGGGGN